MAKRQNKHCFSLHISADFGQILSRRRVVLGHTFKDNEGIYAYQFNIAITWPNYKYIGGVIQVSWLVLWEKSLIIK